MQWNDVRHNDFTKDPGRDWIALDGNGNPIARAVDEEAIRRSAPDAAHYLQGPEKETGTFDHDGDGRAGGSLKHAKAAEEPVVEPAVEDPPVVEPAAEAPAAKHPARKAAKKAGSK